MDKENLFLIYINEIGKDWKGEFIYEFLFSDSINGVDGEDWDEFPAAGNPEPPHRQHIHAVAILKSNYRFDTIQNSDTFCVWDSVDGIIALAWENIDDYEEYPENRIFFKFGDNLKKIEDKFYEHDIIFKEIKSVTENEKNEK